MDRRTTSLRAGGLKNTEGEPSGARRVGLLRLRLFPRRTYGTPLGRHRHEINRFVRLRMRNGLRGFGRIRDVSISGAWIATGLPAKLLSYVQVGFTAMRKGRKTVARVEGVVVRIANQGFGVEWCELAHPAVLPILMVRPYRSEASTAKQGSPL